MAEPLTITDPGDLEALDALARRRDTSPEALLRSLIKAEKHRLDAAERANQAGWDEVFQAAREVARATPEYMRTSNHDWLYDENGLPV